MTISILYRNKLHEISKDKLNSFGERNMLTHVDGEVFMFKPDAIFTLEEAFWFSDLSYPSKRESLSILPHSEFGDNDD